DLVPIGVERAELAERAQTSSGGAARLRGRAHDPELRALPRLRVRRDEPRILSALDGACRHDLHERQSQLRRDGAPFQGDHAGPTWNRLELAGALRLEAPRRHPVRVSDVYRSYRERGDLQ